MNESEILKNIWGDVIMPEGTLCNKQPIQTEESLKTLLGDTGGVQYYKQMKELDVDQDLLWSTI
ncbi:hypothetical protein MHK_010433, partial [Candidatus Magnetomorum sp. HK-1]